jgi:hypothetical protein
MEMPPPPRKPRDASAARQARLEREAVALRENLRKRKEQARARQLPDQPVPAPDAPEKA